MTGLIHDIFARVGEQAMLFFPKLLVSMIVFLAFYVVARVPKKIAIKLGSQADADKSRIYHLFGVTLKIAIIIVGLITALGTLGIDVTAMVAGLGLSGFALGFALKDTISNLLSGILILFYHPFRCGDRIKISGCEGVVKDINLRYTVLAGDDTEYLIPNSTCFTNWVAVNKNARRTTSTN